MSHTISRAQRSLRSVAATGAIALVALAGAVAPTPSTAPAQAMDLATLEETFVIHDDDTYDATVSITDNSGLGFLDEESCQSWVDSDEAVAHNATTDFIKGSDSSTCTITAVGLPISDYDAISHVDDLYIFDETFGGLQDGLGTTLSITFPGKIVENSGGEVDGRTVTFTNPDVVHVEAQDSGSSIMGIILAIIVVLLLIAAAVVVFIVLNKKKKNAQPTYPGFGTTGTMPQAPGQPGVPNQPGMPAPQGSYAQPGYPAPTQGAPAYPQPSAGQPISTPDHNVPGYSQPNPGAPYTGQAPQPGMPPQGGGSQQPGQNPQSGPYGY